MDPHQDFLARYLAIQDDLRGFVEAVVRDRALADDVMQEVALVLWRKFAAYDPARGPFAAWARGIATTEILRQRARFARRQALLPDAAVAALDRAWAGGDGDPWLEALERCLGAVAPGQRALLELRYRDGLDLDAIAARAGRGVEAVGKGLQRLRQALADCVRRRVAAEGGA